MKTKGKILLVSLCAALLVSAGAVGTLAFFSDTDTVTNTFSVGDIDITLDEKDTDNDAKTEDNVTVDDVVRDQANEYHLYPGKKYEKDPTVHIQPNSEDCYVFVKVENGLKDAEAAGNNIATQITANGWTLVSGETDVYYYTGDKATNNIIETSTDVVDLPVFSEFTMRNDLTADNGEENTSSNPDKLSTYEDAEIIVTAYAVQAEGFADAAAAWAATFGAPNQGA